MTKLNQTQVALLKGAAEGGGAVDAPAQRAGKMAATSLIKAGLMISVPLKGGASRLLITEAGKSAVGNGDRGARATAALAAPAPEHGVGPQTRAGPKGKLGILVDLMGRDQGATIGELTGATGWQAHSVRGAISGSLKKTLGLTVTSQPSHAGRCYRLARGAA